MFIWLMMISLRFIQDPLLAGRVVSVGAGLLTLIGIYFLGRELFKSKSIGLISSALYVFFPMSLVYDRMALYDSLVGSFAVWGLLLIILLVRTIRLDVALILGIVIGGAVLNKTNGFFNIYLLPLSLILFNWTGKHVKERLLKWVSLVIVAVILTYAFYSILRLSPFFHIITEKNAIFVYPLKDWLDHPFNFFIGNWKAFWDWTNRYLTWPLLVLAISSFFITRSFTREKLVLFLWFILPIIALGLFGRTLYPRFIFFMLLPLLPLIAFSIVNISRWIKSAYLLIIFFILSFALMVKTDFLILTNFAQAYIPVSDIRQYQTDWPAGGGIRESVEFFKSQSEKGRIYIATQGTFGLMPFAYEIYLVQNPNITIEGLWPIENETPQKVLEKSKQMPTYFVFYQPCVFCVESEIGLAPSTWKSLELVYQFEKEFRQRKLSVYRVMP